jgi:hypothetical protein
VHDADRKLRELEIGQEQDLQNRALEERAAPMMSPTVSRAENVDLSDLMKFISLGNEIKDGAKGKSHGSGSPNPKPTMSVNVSNHSRALKIQFDEISTSTAKVEVMQ